MRKVRWFFFVYEKLIFYPCILTNEKKSVTRLEKTKITFETMTFEKLYYDPSHYAGYSMDNL